MWRALTHLPIFIVLARQEASTSPKHWKSEFSELPHPPQLPKESGSGLVMSVTYLGLLLILLAKYHPDLYTLSVFQDFQFSNLKIPHFFYFFRINPPPNSPKERWSVPVISMTYLGLVLSFSTRFHPDTSTLSVFQHFMLPPPTPPSVTGSNRDLK